MEKIQNVFQKTLEARELSKTQISGGFAAIKSFEVLNAAAENESDGGGVGSFLGAGIGLGAGVPLGSQMGQQMNINTTQNKEAGVEPIERLKKLKDMHEAGLISDDEFTAKKEDILKEL